MAKVRKINFGIGMTNRTSKPKFKNKDNIVLGLMASLIAGEIASKDTKPHIMIDSRNEFYFCSYIHRVEIH